MGASYLHNNLLIYFFRTLVVELLDFLFQSNGNLLQKSHLFLCVAKKKM